jgi:hypothetical protein
MEVFMWIYRYVIRGLGLVFLAGLVTILALAIASQSAHPSHNKQEKKTSGASVSAKTASSARRRP